MNRRHHRQDGSAAEQQAARHRLESPLFRESSQDAGMDSQYQTEQTGALREGEKDVEKGHEVTRRDVEPLWDGKFNGLIPKDRVSRGMTDRDEGIAGSAKDDWDIHSNLPLFPSGKRRSKGRASLKRHAVPK
jgi:hypothetical protein